MADLRVFLGSFFVLRAAALANGQTSLGENVVGHVAYL